MDLEILQIIMDEANKKVIVSNCKKLLKRLNLKSVNDTGYVTELALWLYIFGYYKHAVSVVNILDDIEFDGHYTLWENVKSARLIKVRIFRECGKIDEVNRIMDTILPFENPMLYENQSKCLELYDRNIMSNINSKSSPKGWQLIKLEMAITFRELKDCPIKHETLESMISDLVEVLSKCK